MKNLAIIAFALTVLTSCSEMTDQNHYYVDPQLKAYVDHFYIEASKRGFNLRENANVTIVVGDLSEFNDGKTYYESSKIVINKALVDYLQYGNASDSARVEYVVFHEMGHLVLHREHISTYSIMTPDEAFLYDFSINKEKMVDELFSKK